MFHRNKSKIEVLNIVTDQQFSGGGIILFCLLVLFYILVIDVGLARG